MIFIEDYTNNLYKQLANDIDNAIFKFLNNNGYSIDSITNINRIREIIDELSSQGLFIDYILYNTPYELNENPCSLKVTKVIYPFFNSILNPVNKDEILQVIQEKYAKGELQ